MITLARPHIAMMEMRMEYNGELFGSNASVTASFKKQGFEAIDISEEPLLRLIKRHPATCAQLAGEFNLPADATFKMLRHMVSSGLLLQGIRGEETCCFHRNS